MKIDLPDPFPQRDYVPFGYLDNPYHSSVMNRSGIVRSVPPMGFGYWCRRLPWPYGEGAKRVVNYLSFLHPALVIDGEVFHQQTDFDERGVRIVSRYHTKNAMTYDWSHGGVEVRLLYHLIGENTLACRIELENGNSQTAEIVLHATHIYGYAEEKRWGADGFASRKAEGGAVAKMWAYGDVFLLRSTEDAAYMATADANEWRNWVAGTAGAPPATGATSRRPDPVYTVLTSSFTLASGESRSILVTLTRAVNEVWAVRDAELARAREDEALQELLDEDRRFYETAPVPSGDWPEDWINGWIYDLETIRMNCRRPLGIFKHHWDAMQIFTPRMVLAESGIDAMCLSYGDPALAKDMILGAFSSGPMANAPCLREDGSMNCISAGGEECGTAPIWVLPFRIVRAIYDRDPDAAWIKELYPHLEAFVQWWIDHRTDETGRFFCNNSWESGQDGSKRFLLPEHEEGTESTYVQTVDVEAAMADAMATLGYLAPFAGHSERSAHWSELAAKTATRTLEMFVDGWFRDFDVRTGKPIILPDYLDVMMLLPLSVGLATPEQIEAIKSKFEYFVKNPKPWLEWPSFMFCYTEAGWNAGLRDLMAEVVAATAARAYQRTNGEPIAIGEHPAALPEPYNFRYPGIANEFWPVDVDLTGCGSEAYGWGATLPTLIIRNIAGFRETAMGYELEPHLPGALRFPGRVYEISNLSWRGKRFGVRIEVKDDGSLESTEFGIPCSL
ncbi:MAG TPA: trehalase family glycosidase [Fimbriimonadaceae bacterium]|nr:trehalase family glycosidase [Fimbriimonadaceae bacterium]